MNLLENERFEKAVIGEDMAVCYDKSLKEFEHSSVHDLFKVITLITFTSSCHSNMYMYIYFLTKFLFTCVGLVKVHSYVQEGHRDGQDENPRGQG